jgi:hypothetical protein
VWLAVGALAVAGAAGLVVWQATRRTGGTEVATSEASVATRVDAELATADQRISEGRVVAGGGDDALAHLLAARTLDPHNAAVRDRLHAIAGKYQQLADQAIAAGSLAEAAAELQTVVAAEPDNAGAAAKMREIEDKILRKQRGNGR